MSRLIPSILIALAAIAGALPAVAQEATPVGLDDCRAASSSATPEAGGTPPALSPINDVGQVITGFDFQGLIVSEAAASDFFAGFVGIAAREGYWQPTPDDVLRLEACLEPFLQAAAAERSPDLWQKVADYKRQYIGVVDDGRQQVFANYFCEGFDVWQLQPIAVSDGGDCFFSLWFDVESGEFSRLQINGEA